MTEEEKRAKAAANKRAYRQRKREELAQQASPEELTTMFNEQYQTSSTYVEEEAFRNAKGTSEIRPMHPLADEPALLADSILNSYARDFSNANALLKHILAHLIRIEIALEGRK